MAKEEKIEAEGVVIEALRGTKFRVKLNDVDAVIIAGEISPYDAGKGRIIWRSK